MYYEAHRKKLPISEEYFYLSFQGSNDGIWDWQDVSQEKYWWSDRVYEMLGYKPGAFQPTISFWRDNMHPEDCDKVRRVLEDHLLEDLAYQVDFWIKKKNSEYI